MTTPYPPVRRVIVLFLGLMALAGCRISVQSSVNPGTDMHRLKKFYVVHNPADTRRTWELLESGLKSLDRQVISGSARTVPGDVDAVVTYVDTWAWDKDWFLLSLIVQFRDPKTNVLQATFESQRASLSRKPPEAVIAEVLRLAFTPR